MGVRAINIDIRPNKKYRQLYEAPAMRNDIWGGRGRGGSHAATEYALYRLTSPDYARIAFIRKIYSDVRHSLWKDFKDRVQEARDRGSDLTEEDLRIADHAMESTYHPTGNTINCFGVKAEGGRTAKLKSLAGYNVVIIEECDELTEEEFNQLEDSLRTVKGKEEPMIIRVFNPPGRTHWIWKDYNLTESFEPGYWKAGPKSGMNLLSVFGTYRDNVKNLAPSKLLKWLRYKESNPDYYYTIIEGLISEGQRGRIHSGWDPITNDQFNEIDARSVFWLDFGMMALGEAKFVNSTGYVREHLYKDCTLLEVAIRLCELGLTGDDLIIADSAEPASISQLRRGWRLEELAHIPDVGEKYPQLLKGFHVMGAQKGPGSIIFGIKKMKEMKWFVTEDSVNIWEEYRSYKWALDKDKNPTNVPEDKNNHHMDGIRYLATSRGRLF